MIQEIGFDNNKYLELQSESIIKRVNMFGDKLYLELGGKLFDDFHAARVLPGFQPDTKMRMLKRLVDKIEIVVAISAIDIENNKVRNDYNITYDMDVIRLIDTFRANGFYVGSVAITKYKGQKAAELFQQKLESLGVSVYKLRYIEGYPYDLDKIASDAGFGKNDYIRTTRPIVVLTAPGPGSGKMTVCMSQLYQENQHGVKAGYAKFETFPVWNLPLKHSVNLAYEAATVDLDDVNMIDSFHLEAYNEIAINYNRDVESFPVLNRLLTRILGENPYKSPTDMGVNMVGFCITKEEVVCKAAKDEIYRRYFQVLKEKAQGKATEDSVRKIELVMQQAGIVGTERPVIQQALEKESITGVYSTALELRDGRVVVGRTTRTLTATSAVVLNALKVLAGIDDNKHLLYPDVLRPLQTLKKEHLSTSERLDINETLIALSICAVNERNASAAISKIAELSGTELHSTVMLNPVEETVLKRLGVNLTCEPKYAKSLN